MRTGGLLHSRISVWKEVVDFAHGSTSVWNDLDRQIQAFTLGNLRWISARESCAKKGEESGCKSSRCKSWHCCWSDKGRQCHEKNCERSFGRQILSWISTTG